MVGPRRFDISNLFMLSLARLSLKNICMIRVAGAGEVGLVTGKHGLAQATLGDNAGLAGGGVTGNGMNGLAGRWQLLLAQLGITTAPDVGPVAAADVQGGSEAAVQENGSGRPSRLPMMAGHKTETGENAAAAACCKVQADPRTARVFHLEASLEQSAHEKEPNKSGLEVRDSSEIKSKQAKTASHSQDYEKRDEQAGAAVPQVFIPLSEPVPSVGAPRPLEARPVQERRNPFDRGLGLGQPEHVEVALPASDPVPAGRAAGAYAPKSRLPESKTEAKEAAGVAMDHAVVTGSKHEGLPSETSERMGNSIHSDVTSASRGDEFRIAGTSSGGASSSTPSTFSRHSQSRNDRSHVRAVEGRAAINAIDSGVGESSYRDALTFKPEDRSAVDARSNIGRGSLESLDRPSAMPELPLRHPEQQWTHVGPHFAEAGFHDDTLGWVSVRAARDSSGVHAVLVPPSAEAERTLSGHMNGLNTYLGNNQIPVSAVTLSTFENARQGTSFGADAQQHNGRDGCDERNGRSQRDAIQLERGSTAVGSGSQTDAERYESIWNRSGYMSSAKTRISLVA